MTGTKVESDDTVERQSIHGDEAVDAFVNKTVDFNRGDCRLRHFQPQLHTFSSMITILPFPFHIQGPCITTYFDSPS